LAPKPPIVISMNINPFNPLKVKSNKGRLLSFLGSIAIIIITIATCVLYSYARDREILYYVPHAKLVYDNLQEEYIVDASKGHINIKTNTFPVFGHKIEKGKGIVIAYRRKINYASNLIDISQKYGYEYLTLYINDITIVAGEKHSLSAAASNVHTFYTIGDLDNPVNACSGYALKGRVDLEIKNEYSINVDIDIVINSNELMAIIKDMDSEDIGQWSFRYCNAYHFKISQVVNKAYIEYSPEWEGRYAWRRLNQVSNLQ